MFKRVLKGLLSHTPAIVLVVIAVVICYSNYSPDTFLTGWDTLHPEFNFKIYWERIINGAWQDHQGLGAVATQAHASEIPRVLILSILNFFLAMSQLRYVYVFLMLIIGSLGVYFFTKDILLKKFSDPIRYLGAFSAGLFYLLNLGTLQHFYVPLEMFVTQYGYLGWLFLFACKYFEYGKKRDLMLFGVLSFFSAPQAHTSTLFYVYVISLLIFLLVTRALVKSSSSLKRIFKIIIVILALNSFWLFPNVYFISIHGAEVQKSDIHHLFSDEAFLANKKYGKIKDIAILRNFLFDWGEHVGGGQFGSLFNEWNSHHKKVGVLPIGYLLFSITVLGFYFSFKNKNKYGASLSVLFLIGIFFLFNLNPPLGFLFRFFQKSLPLFEEAFRFPFTKFSILLMFSYAGLFGLGISQICNFIYTKLNESKLIVLVFFFIISGGIGYYMWPAFDGGMVSPSMRVKIPDRYFKMFKHLNEQKEYGRVMHLPIHTMWGWVYNSWDKSTQLGHQGAGFLWFGIKQPLVDREFDRWNLLNEQVYREISYSVYSKDYKLFLNLLEKYKIRWLFIDKSVIAPGHDSKVLFYNELEEMISQTDKIVLDKDFGEGLVLFKYQPINAFEIKEVSPNFIYGSNNFKDFKDPIYLNERDYVVSNREQYPFLGMSDHEGYISTKYISSDNEYTYLKVLPENTYLEAFSLENKLPFKVYASNNGTNIKVELVSVFLAPSIKQEYEISSGVSTEEDRIIRINNDLFVLRSGESNVLLGEIIMEPGVFNLSVYNKTRNVVDSESLFESEFEACSTSGKNASYEIRKTASGVSLFARNIRACITKPFSEIFVSGVSSDLVRISVGSLKRSLLCIFDPLEGLCVNNELSDGDHYFFMEKTPQDYYLRLFSDATKSQTNVETVFEDISVSSLEKVYNASITWQIPTSEEYSVLSSQKFLKNQIFSGNVNDLMSDTRYCVSGDRDFRDEDFRLVDNGRVYDARKESICDSFQLPQLQHNTGFILEIKAQNLYGVPLRLCLTNESTKRCDLYVSLPKDSEYKSFYYLIPPMGEGRGYTVNLSNSVFGDERSTNLLSYIGITPVPYNVLLSSHLPLDVKEDNLLVYNQAFETGWSALCSYRPCNVPHVMVNNWANGWVFEDNVDLSKVKIVFWPQVMEYIGFLFVIATFLWIRITPDES